MQHGWNTLSTTPAPTSSLVAGTGTRRDAPDRLWPWYGATAIYVGLTVWVLYTRRSELGFDCTVGDAKCGSLQLNDIGDIAAGIFAPLAFLWLFVATLLQRRELGLQRKELEDTRKVLADQQRELEISAKESAYQTEIMQRTLDATVSRTYYDEFNIKLYYAAKLWIRLNWFSIYVRFSNGQNDRDVLLDFSDQSLLTQDNPTMIDNFFDHMYMRSMHILKLTASHAEIMIDSDKKDHLAEVFTHGIPIILDLVETSNVTENPLIKARAEGIDLEATQRALMAIELVILK